MMTSNQKVGLTKHLVPSIFHQIQGEAKVQAIFVACLDEVFRRNRGKHIILLPGSNRYEIQRKDMSNRYHICSPCLILQPKTAREISSCLIAYTAGVRKCLKENRIPGATLPVPRLCVAGGRNSINSMKTGSIVLDLSQMRNVTVDEITKTCTVEGGARVIDLISKLGDYGLIAVTGIYEQLGVIGSILGGGLGYTSRKYGLACDNVLSAEIILADGRLKTCNPHKHDDLYWSLCGGGGGLGVVVSVTLQCYPLRNAALLTYDLHTPSIQIRRAMIKNWDHWVCGEEAPEDVYSHLMLPTDSSQVSFVGTSIDTNKIPQTKKSVKINNDLAKKKSKQPFSFSYPRPTQSNEQFSQTCCWGKIPGLTELQSNTFGSDRSNEQIRILGFDELQSHSNKYFVPGNNSFVATKFTCILNDRVIKILAQATIGDNSPSNISRIFVMSGGKAINNMKPESAFLARNMKYLIFVEGRWKDDADEKNNKIREKVVDWVHWVVNRLNYCDEVQSTAYPESTRDQISRSGNSRSPVGFHNFSEKAGKRLIEIKKKRDSKNVFSLYTRISWNENSKLGTKKRDKSLHMITSDNQPIVKSSSKQLKISTVHLIKGGVCKSKVKQNSADIKSSTTTSRDYLKKITANDCLYHVPNHYNKGKIDTMNERMYIPIKAIDEGSDSDEWVSFGSISNKNFTYAVDSHKQVSHSDSQDQISRVFSH